MKITRRHLGDLIREETLHALIEADVDTDADEDDEKPSSYREYSRSAETEYRKKAEAISSPVLRAQALQVGVDGYKSGDITEAEMRQLVDALVKHDKSPHPWTTATKKWFSDLKKKVSGTLSTPAQAPKSVRESTNSITRGDVRKLILNEMKKTRVFDIYPKVHKQKHGGTWGEPGEEKMGRLRVDEPITGPDLHTSLSPYTLQTIGKIAPVFDEDGDGVVDWNEVESLIAHLVASSEAKDEPEALMLPNPMKQVDPTYGYGLTADQWIERQRRKIRK